MKKREIEIREDCAKYAAWIATYCLDDEKVKREMQDKHGVMGLMYLIAGKAMAFEKKTRRVNWAARSERDGMAWDVELDAYIDREGL